MDMKYRIWIYEFKGSYPMTGYQAKTVCEDFTPIFGYGLTQDLAVADLVDKVYNYYNTFEYLEKGYLTIESKNKWTYIGEEGYEIEKSLV